MKKEDNYSEIQKMFQDTFSGVEATDIMRKKIKSGIQENDTQQKTAIHRVQLWKKAILTAACLLLIVGIANFDTIKAGMMDAYEYLFHHVAENQYQKNTNEYTLDVGQKIQLEDDFSIEISQAVFLDDGIDFKFIEDKNIDTKKYEFAGCAWLQVENEGDLYDLNQEMFLKLEQGYLSSLSFADTDNNMEWVVGKTLKFHITFYYFVYDKNDTGEYKQKESTLELTPEKIKTTQYCTSENREIYRDKFLEIRSIELKGWYMKVTYDVLYAYDTLTEIPKPSISLKGQSTPLLDLGFDGGGSSSEISMDDENVKNETTRKESNVVYLELPWDTGDEFFIESRCLKFNGTEWKDSKLSEGKNVTIQWN